MSSNLTLHATVSDFNDIEELFNNDPWSRKKDEKEKTEFDLLVLSCALFRIRTTNAITDENRYLHNMSLVDSALAKHVTEEDYALASLVKEHFSQKLLMLQLKSVRLTPFREDMNKFLHNNYHDPSGLFVYPKNFVPLAYKLPYLYDYDMKIREVFDTDYKSIVGPETIKGDKTLTHVKTIKSVVRKDSGKIEYWFIDDNANKVMVSLEKTNPLLSVFDSLVKKPIILKGKFEARRKDTLQFYNMPNWEVVI